jgi:hypothetical protein
MLQRMRLNGPSIILMELPDGLQETWCKTGRRTISDRYQGWSLYWVKGQSFLAMQLTYNK